MNWDVLSRFRKPLEFFVPRLAEKFDEADHNKKLVGAFKRTFGTPEGEIVLKHLIEITDLDKPIGNVPPDEKAFVLAQQDIVKEILSYIN